MCAALCLLRSLLPFLPIEIPPLLLVREFCKRFAIERTVIEDSARCFKVAIAIYERIVDAIRYTYAEMLNLAVKLLAVDFADDADEDSNFHLCSPFLSSQGFNVPEDCILYSAQRNTL